MTMVDAGDGAPERACIPDDVRVMEKSQGFPIPPFPRLPKRAVRSRCSPARGMVSQVSPVKSIAARQLGNPIWRSGFESRGLNRGLKLSETQST